MIDHDLPLQPEPTPQERSELDELSAWLDEWAVEASERVPLPEGARATPPSAAAEAREPGTRIPAWMRSPRVAAAVLAASVTAFLLLPDPGSGPVAPPPPAVGPTGTALQAIDLEVASPHPYMIVPSRDPTISIVWLLDTDTDEGD